MQNPAQKLRDAIKRSLRRQGYVLGRDGTLSPRDSEVSKETLRALNRMAVEERRLRAQAQLHRREEQLLNLIADGTEVDPRRIKPRIVLVEPNTEGELLFRYATVHWSIPVSSGYGRRLRFLIIDESNGKLMGILGLADPVFSLGSRDEWIGWSVQDRQRRLFHVMDAYVLGAVPPYSHLLCGKLVALLALSTEVRCAFRRRYTNHVSLISKERHPPHLVMVTTTSALGRSSIYNRLTANGLTYWHSVGFTAGSGEFHFSDRIYSAMKDFLATRAPPSWRHRAWGEGFRNRREVVRKCLSELGLPKRLSNHGIKREIFVAALAEKSAPYLRGEIDRPLFRNWSAADLFEVFRDRWLLKRALSAPLYRSFSREDYRLWPPQGTKSRQPEARRQKAVAL